MEAIARQTKVTPEPPEIAVRTPQQPPPPPLPPAASPEFADCSGIEELFGIRRSLAYQLLADGCIRSVSLKRKGQARGKRLIDVESVRAYLRSQMSLNVTATAAAGEVISAQSRISMSSDIIA